MIGPFVSGLIIDHLGMDLPWLIMAALSAFIGLMLPILISSGRQSQKSFPDPDPPKARIRDLINITTIVGILSSFVILFALGSRRIFYPIFLKDLGFSASVIGAMMSLRAFVTLFSRMSAGPAARRFGSRMAVLSVCLFVLTLGIGTTSICRTIALLVINSVVMGLGLGMAMPLSQATVFESAPADQKGIAMGVRMTGNRLAQMTSPLLFGIVSQFYGIPTAFWIAGLILFLVSVPVFLWWRRTEGNSTN
jgi:MFS family permease